MPKTLALNRYERKMNSFRNWFRGKRAEKKVPQALLANRLDISQVAVSNKIKESADSQITYKDLLVFFESVEASDEEIVRMMRIQKGE